MRNRRDWFVDIAFFLFAVVFSVVTADSVHLDESMSGGEQIADQVAGGLACALVFLRRRCPVRLAVVLMLAGTYFHHLTGATLVALFTVAVHRRRRVTAWVAAVALVQFLVFLARGPDTASEAASSAFTYFALVAGASAGGCTYAPGGRWSRRWRNALPELPTRPDDRHGRRSPGRCTTSSPTGCRC
ncbi:DUF7134 domain-containing protein [Streptomyces odonnellii]|uniref:DUF7134 domain-containing protein n=1 Tax=Streptomyces odonnellii TaxID=1417980 RepID=UPI000B101CC4